MFPLVRGLRCGWVGSWVAGVRLTWPFAASGSAAGCFLGGFGFVAGDAAGSAVVEGGGSAFGGGDLVVGLDVAGSWVALVAAVDALVAVVAVDCSGPASVFGGSGSASASVSPRHGLPDDWCGPDLDLACSHGAYRDQVLVEGDLVFVDEQCDCDGA